MRLLDKTGSISTYMHVDEMSGDITIKTEQDLTGFLDHMKRLRESGEDRWRKGVKEEWMRYASIPTVVQMELMNKGIDIFNPDDEKALSREINTNYPYLKTVDHKKHG